MGFASFRARRTYPLVGMPLHVASPCLAWRIIAESRASARPAPLRSLRSRWHGALLLEQCSAGVQLVPRALIPLQTPVDGLVSMGQRTSSRLGFNFVFWCHFHGILHADR